MCVCVCVCITCYLDWYISIHFAIICSKTKINNVNYTVEGFEDVDF